MAVASSSSDAALNDGYVDWPHLGRCFQLVSERTVGGATATEKVYGITSLTRAKADAWRLLKRVHFHRSVEALFQVRDVTFGEDACRARTGAAPLVLSRLRNVAITLLGQTGMSNKAAARLRHAARSEEVKGGSG